MVHDDGCLKLLLSFDRSLGQIFLLFGQYVKGIASGTRVFELIKQEPLIPLRGGTTIEDAAFAGEIRLRNVTFSYPNRPEQKVLENLTIAIPPGKVVALCGASGCGKSTIAALIERSLSWIWGKISEVSFVTENLMKSSVIIINGDLFFVF